jgi:MFS family permease
VAQRIGPGIAGVMIGLLTAPFALLLDAVSYVVSTVLLLWIRRAEPALASRGREATERPSMRAEIAVGLRYVTGHRWLRGLALTVALGSLFGTLADSILILYLVSEHQFPPALIGLAFSIGSVGIIAGALIANRVTKAIGVGPTIVLAAVGESLSWLPVAAAPEALLFAGLTTTIVALSFFGVGWQVNALSLRQAITPRSMRGRVNATMRFVSWSAIPIGSVLGGFLGGVIGLHNTIWLGALGSLVVFVPVALSSIWSVREMPAPEVEPGVEAASA